jgi:hypothetical protein
MFAWANCSWLLLGLSAMEMCQGDSCAAEGFRCLGDLLWQSLVHRWPAVVLSLLPRLDQSDSCAAKGFQCLGDLLWQSLVLVGLLWHYLVFRRAAKPGLYLRLSRKWLLFRYSLLRFFFGSPLNWRPIGTGGWLCSRREAVRWIWLRRDCRLASKSA